MNQLEDVGLFGVLARRLDDDVHGAPVGQQADAEMVPRRQAQLVQEPVGPIQIEAGPPRAVLLPVELASGLDRVVALDGEPEINHLVDLVAVDGKGQRPPEIRLADQGAPHRIADVEVGVERHVRPLGRRPQADGEIVPRFPPLEEGEVVELEIAGLKVGFPAARLGGDQFGAGDGHDHPVRVGKLPAFGIDPVIIGIARENESVGRRLGGQDPRLKGRQLRIDVPVLAALAEQERHPVALFFLLHLEFKFRRVRVAFMKLLQVMGGAIDEKRAGAGQPGQEEWIGAGPGVAHRGLVDDLEYWPLPVHQHGSGRARRRELLVVCHVLPIETQVLGGEGVAVGPFVPLAQAHGEDAAFLDVDSGKNVRHQVEVPVVAHQAGVAVDHHHPGVLGPSHEQAQAAAVAARLQAGIAEVGHGHVFRQAGANRRKLAVGDPPGERRRFHEFQRRPEDGKRGHQQDQEASENHLHDAAFRGRAWARTMCPPPRSTRPGSPSPLKGGGQAEGSEALPSCKAAKSSRWLGSG